MSTDQAVLSVENVARHYGRGNELTEVLKGVSFDLRQGEIVGLLGINGAGKTTLLKIISTLLIPSAGTVRVAGYDVQSRTRQARQHFSVVFGGDQGLYGRLSALDNARFFGTLSGVGAARLDAQARAAMDRVGLGDAAHRRVETFSKGMHQRLHLAIGLMSAPELLLLDEPTVGLDPVEAERLRDAVAALRDQGTTVLLTSHYLKDIERLASRVILLRDGVVSHDLPLRELLASSPAARVRILGLGNAPAAEQVRSVLGPDAGIRVREVEHLADGRWQMELDLAVWTRHSLGALMQAWPDGEVLDVSIEPITLEDVFTRMSRKSVPG